MTQNQDYVEAGKVSEITVGHMKHDLQIKKFLLSINLTLLSQSTG